MVSLSIDGIRLDFDDAWSAVKWDDTRWYRDGIHKPNGELAGNPEGCKAVDAIGVRQIVGEHGAIRDLPFLFEVKDFRGFAIENKRRQLVELPLEVGLKSRDTVAGLFGWVALGKRDDLPLRWVRAVHDDHQPIRVVALIAEDAARPGEVAHKREARKSECASRIRQRMAWLTPRVAVSDPLRDADLAPLGITAHSEPGAGPARR